jgi:co-chaperonin GroES (HSP10)
MSVSPLAGFAFVKMQGVYDSASGLIDIPERFKTKRHGFGELVAASPTPADDRSISMSYSDAVGNRVIFNDYSKAPVGEDVYRVPISSIIAIVTDSAISIQSVAPFQGVERCQWCGPAKEGSPNSMILMDGYCPRCGKNAEGEKRDEFSEKALKPFMR